MDMTAAHKCVEAADESNPTDGLRWLTTFNDLITLLMVFFVLLFRRYLNYS